MKCPKCNKTTWVVAICNISNPVFNCFYKFIEHTHGYCKNPECKYEWIGLETIEELNTLSIELNEYLTKNAINEFHNE